MSEFGMDQGEEEPIESIALAPVAKIHRPVKSTPRLFPVAKAIIGDAQGIPDRAVIRATGPRRGGRISRRLSDCAT